eukprot:scpid79539/ scgid23216/ Ras-related protein Rab-27A
MEEIRREDNRREEIKRAPNAALSSQTTGDYDYLIKLLALGDSGVGKTSLLSRFVNGAFDANIGTTIGLDFFERRVTRRGSRINLQLWDTSGQERFRSVTSSIYRNAYGYMMVFDLTNEKTFMNIRDWLTTLRENVASITDDPDVILVGNKVDLHDLHDSSEDMVDLAEVQKWADDNDMTFIQTSARTGSGVDAAFNALIEIVMASMEKQLRRKLSLPDLTAEQQSSSCRC